MWLSDSRAQLSPPGKYEPGVETIEVSNDHGSYTYLLFRITPCAVIDDLTASIRIRSAQSGLRMGFRIVFPRSTNPATHDPIVEVVLGSPSEGAGRWSTSTIRNVVSQYETKLRFLRAKYGASIDLSDAYIDGVVLSVYSLPGTIKLQVDDLQVEGMLSPSLENTEAVLSGTEANYAKVPVAEQLRQLQDSVPRWIQHHGESLDYLKSLGFTAIVTHHPDDPLITEQAARSKIGLIAPPPTLVPVEEMSSNYKHVQGWLLGMALDQSHIDQTRTRVSRMTRFPASMARPMIGEALESYGSFSRLSDWLSIPMPLPTRVHSSAESRQIMLSDLRPMAGRSTPLTSIVTQLPIEWIAQKNAAMRAVVGESTDSIDCDMLQMRLQVYRSMMQGTRGWIFRSSTPLDTGDMTSNARSQAYGGINQEIELFAPWIRASQSGWRSVPTDSEEHTGALLETPNSQLAIIVAAGPMDQICSVAPAKDRIQITLPLAGQLRNTFRVTHGELEALRPQQTPNGMVITIDRPALVEQIVSVVDPKPVAYLREQLSRMAPQLVESRLEITQQVLDTAQRTLLAQQIPRSDPRWDEVEKSRSEYRMATQYLSRSRIVQALKSADGALLGAQRVVRNAWLDAANQFNAIQSSPLVVSPLTLPLHFEMNRILGGRTWQSVQIPGVPINDHHSFFQSGWSVERRLSEEVQSVCVITSTGPGGEPSLEFSTQPTNNQRIATGYAGASMRLASPPIDVPLGSMVHIEGLVRIESPADESQSGLLISDSLGGESLGQLVSSAERSNYPWRRFSLVRFVTHPEGVRIFFEARGQIRAIVADLRAESIVPSLPAGLPVQTIESSEPVIQSTSIPVDSRRISQPPR